ncbi:MAG: orotate phosphoribosyltransferase [Candidatus Pacearchaeota archaeon]
MSLLEKLKEIEILEEVEVDLKNAGKSRLYVNVKKVYGYPDLLRDVAVEIGHKFPKGITCVATQGYGGIPLGTAVSLTKGCKLTLVREGPKSYGLRSWIDGYSPKRDDRIWVLDDVLTTGESLRKMAGILGAHGGNVVGASVVVKRGEAELPFPCSYLFSLEDLTG